MIIINVSLIVKYIFQYFVKLLSEEINEMFNMKEIREEKCLQQKDIAKMLNRTTACISSWETGKTEPSIEDLKQLAKILETSIDYLVGYCDEFGNVDIHYEDQPVIHKIMSSSLRLKREDQYQVLGFIQALQK